MIPLAKFANTGFLTSSDPRDDPRLLPRLRRARGPISGGHENPRKILEGWNNQPQNPQFETSHVKLATSNGYG